MLPPEVKQHIQTIDAKVKSVDNTLLVIEDQCNFSDFNKMQNIASNYIIIASAGLVEKGIQSILGSCLSKQCSPQISYYLRSNLERQTSMNCEKIENLLRRFDPLWADEFSQKVAGEHKFALDSIKTLRDVLAHGKTNGTGLNTVKGYYKHCKKTLDIFSSVIN